MTTTTKTYLTSKPYPIYHRGDMSMSAFFVDASTKDIFMTRYADTDSLGMSAFFTSASTRSSGTKSITPMSAGTGDNGGTATNSTGGLGGTGGVASGGNVTNADGNYGFDGDPTDLGSGGSAGGALRTAGLYGRGADGSFTTGTNTSFGPAAVEFYYT